MERTAPLCGKTVTRLTDYAGGLAAFGILAIVLLQVASRLLSVPVAWTEEATRYLFIWMIFLGIAAGFRSVEMARIVLFLAVLPSLFRRWSVWIYAASSLLFFILIGWTGMNLVRQQYLMNETAATLGVPMWLIGAVLPVSAALAIFAIVDSLRAHRDLIAPSDEAMT